MPIMTDAQWAKFEAAIAAVGIRGARPRKDERRTIEAIVWRLDNGAKWRSIPAELVRWHHAYLRFRRWTLSGVWDRIMAYVSAQAEPKLAFACIDGTIARAHQKATGARLTKRAGKQASCACDSCAAPHAQVRRWAAREAGWARRSWVFATPQAGCSTLSWCLGRRTSLRHPCGC